MRTGVVIGIPWRVVASRFVLRWILSPALRRALPRTVTWMAPDRARRFHAAAAVAWLRAPLVASVAAIQRPSTFSTVWPAEYTPR